MKNIKRINIGATPEKTTQISNSNKPQKKLGRDTEIAAIVRSSLLIIIAEGW